MVQGAHHQSHGQDVATLRSINFRISSTPTKQLPHSVTQIAALLWNIQSLLSASPETLRPNAEASNLVHRFKTTLSALLQDRTVEGRWSAVVLVKATIEAGGIEAVSKSAPWIKSLLTILKKPDPPTTKILASLTLTKIFMLTWDHPNLVREITTPSLPTFISSSLSIIQHPRCSSDELQVVLESFAALMPRHPTLFRTNEAQIRVILLKVLSDTSSANSDQIHYTRKHQAVAQRLFVLLHHCAAKQAGAQKWEETVNATVDAAHATCDILFRAVVESPHTKPLSNNTREHPSSNAELGSFGQDPLGLAEWHGIFPGSERVVSLLGILQTHVAVPTALSTNFQIGQTLGLVHRLLSLVVPTADEWYGPRINPEIPKDEREAMFSILPVVHVATLKLVRALFARLGISMASTMHGLMDLVVNTFRAEQSHHEIRTATYDVLVTILSIGGWTMPKSDVVDLTAVVKRCCEDVSRPEPTSTTDVTSSTSVQQPSHGDASPHLYERQSTSRVGKDNLRASAENLLTVLFSRIDSEYMPRKLRVLMERAAIFTRHKEALIASVMNPAKWSNQANLHPSLLPLLARFYPDCAEVEALLRPRMPVMSSGAESAARDDSEEDSIDTSELVDSAELNAGMKEDSGDGMDVGGREAADDGVESETALGRHRDLHLVRDHGDLYSTTRDHVALSEAGNQAEKRQAPAPPDLEVSAKRMKASSVVETLLPDSTPALPGPDHSTASEALPATVSTEPPRPEVMDTVTATLATGPGESEKPVGSSSLVQEAEDDSSDPEIPEIDPTMDTESEDDADDQAIME